MDAELAQLREGLAARVVAANRITSERVAAALRAVPRHLFLPGLPPQAAYRDEAIVTKRDQAGQPISSSSQPAIMAIMLEQLDLAPGQRVLEIGAGTGYNAALISHVVGAQGQVTSVDIDPGLVVQAREHLARAGFEAVTVACADGAAGYRERAPYDRVIATVGVADLAPAWLAQAAPQARVVVPLDLRGIQLSAAFERSGPAGPWVSRSLAPCGFMRMRGSLAGPELVITLAPGLSLLVPDGTFPGAPGVADAGALAGLLAGPSVPHPTGVRAGPAQAFWGGLGLWLAAHEPRSCRLNEERSPGDQGGLLTAAPLRGAGWQGTLGIAGGGGLAILTAGPSAGTESGPSAQQVNLETAVLGTAGFGPRGAPLAADLAAHVQAWDQAGRPGLPGLHLDAYPRSTAARGPAAGGPDPAAGALIIERPGTRFAVYHD